MFVFVCFLHFIFLLSFLRFSFFADFIFVTIFKMSSGYSSLLCPYFAFTKGGMCELRQTADITSQHARVHFTGTGGEGLSCVPEFRIHTREVKYITVTRVQAPRHQSHTQQNCCCSICASLFIKRRGSIILDIGRKLELLEPAGEQLLN